jgi:predicted nucleic acid-binding protein
MNAADTSIAVAMFASWHEHHEAARRLLAEELHLIEHSMLETYSVLTRLPAPHRAAPDLVRTFLASWTPRRLLRLTPAAYERFVLALPDHGVTGGAAYDALIAATAAAHGATLCTCDRRARTVYDRYGVDVRLL